jgi:hypothetical protein
LEKPKIFLNKNYLVVKKLGKLESQGCGGAEIWGFSAFFLNWHQPTRNAGLFCANRGIFYGNCSEGAGFTPATIMCDYFPKYENKALTYKKTK